MFCSFCDCQVISMRWDLGYFFKIFLATVSFSSFFLFLDIKQHSALGTATLAQQKRKWRNRKKQQQDHHSIFFQRLFLEKYISVNCLLKKRKNLPSSNQQKWINKKEKTFGSPSGFIFLCKPVLIKLCRIYAICFLSLSSFAWPVHFCRNIQALWSLGLLGKP